MISCVVSKEVMTWVKYKPYEMTGYGVDMRYEYRVWDDKCTTHEI